MTIFEYLGAIWNAVKGIRSTEMQEDQKLSDAATTLADILARVKRIQTIGGDILSAEGSIGAELHEIAVEQVRQGTGLHGVDGKVNALQIYLIDVVALVNKILEAVTPPPGPDPQQEEVDALTQRLTDSKGRLEAAMAAIQAPQ